MQEQTWNSYKLTGGGLYRDIHLLAYTPVGYAPPISSHLRGVLFTAPCLQIVPGHTILKQPKMRSGMSSRQIEIFVCMGTITPLWFLRNSALSAHLSYSLTGRVVLPISLKLSKPEGRLWKASLLFIRPSIQTLANLISKGRPFTLGVLLTLAPGNSSKSAFSPHAIITSVTFLPSFIPPVVNRLVDLGPPVPVCHTQVSCCPHFETLRHSWPGEGVDRRREGR